jgi:hypothetical protein
MASTKKPRVSKESIEFFEKELKSIDELYREFDREQKKVKNEIEATKNITIDNIFDTFEENLQEIHTLKQIRNKDRFDIITKIMKKNKKYSYEYLDEFEYETLINMYNSLINKRKNFFIKLLKFFNLLK